MSEKAPAIRKAMRKDCQPRTRCCWEASATEKNHATITTPFFVHWSTRIARSQVFNR